MAQFRVLNSSISINGSACVAARQVLHTMCTSPELPRAALQALAAACVDMQEKFKAKAIEQQQLKRKSHKQHQRQRQQQQHPQQQPLQAPTQMAVNPILMEMAVPADHEGSGLLPGWENGLSRTTFPGVFQISPQAYVCMVAEFALRRHLGVISLGANELEESQSKGVATIPSPVRCLGGMKLLLEAALLLQGVEPEAGAHHELQVLLNMVIALAPREEVVALLRERGGLIMQAVRVTEPEEFLYGITGDPIPWREREVNWVGLGHGEAVWFDWMRTVNAIAMRLGNVERGLVGGWQRGEKACASNAPGQ